MAKTKGAKTGKFGSRINKKEFEDLCKIMCTQSEICSAFDISHDTLNRWCKQEYGKTFIETYEDKCNDGRISLRRIQFRFADTNPTMAIFLGKQWLGQSDQVEQRNETRIEVFNDVPTEEDK